MTKFVSAVRLNMDTRAEEAEGTVRSELSFSKSLESTQKECALLRRRHKLRARVSCEKI